MANQTPSIPSKSFVEATQSLLKSFLETNDEAYICAGVETFLMSINQKFPDDPELPEVQALLEPIVEASYRGDYKQAVQLTRLASHQRGQMKA